MSDSDDKIVNIFAARKDLMGLALAEMPQERALEISRAANEQGIPPHDPIWMMVYAAAIIRQDADRAAAAAQAAERGAQYVSDAIASLPNLVESSIGKLTNKAAVHIAEQVPSIVGKALNDKLPYELAKHSETIRAHYDQHFMAQATSAVEQIKNYENKLYSTTQRFLGAGGRFMTFLTLSAIASSALGSFLAIYIITH